MKALLAVVVVLSLCYLTQQQSCDNPLRTSSRWWGVFTNNLLTSPTTQAASDGSICQAAGNQTCCGPAYYTALRQAWVQAIQEQHDNVAAFNAFSAKWNLYVQHYQNLDLDTAFPNLTADQKQALENVINAMIAAVNTFINDVPSAYRQCGGTLLTYYAGIACFLCRPDWANFVTSLPLGYKFALAEHVCDDLVDGCTNLLVVYTTFVDSLLSAITGLGGIIGAGAAADDSAFDNTTFSCKSNDDCKAKICSPNFITGTNTNSVTSGLSTTTVPTARFLSFASKDQKTGKVLQDFEKHISEAMDHGSRLTRAWNHTVATRDATIENDYSSSGGYDATNVGANTGLDTSVSSASSIASWFALF